MSANDHQSLKGQESVRQRLAVIAAQPGVRLDDPISRTDNALILKAAFRRALKWTGWTWGTSFVIASYIGFDPSWWGILEGTLAILFFGPGLTTYSLERIERANSGLAADGNGYWEEQGEPADNGYDANPLPNWYVLKPQKVLTDRNHADYMNAGIWQLLGMFILIQMLT